MVGDADLVIGLVLGVLAWCLVFMFGLWNGGPE